jgi:hypothetical protein
MTLFEKLIRRYIPFKEIGWAEIGEKFTRYQLLKTRWFNIYLHQLSAPKWHPQCHDHPWSFVAILLKSGYLEESVRDAGNGDWYHEVKAHKPGSILYRPAEFSHNVITPFGTSWSIIFTGPKVRQWGFLTCE